MVHGQMLRDKSHKRRVLFCWGLGHTPHLVSFKSNGWPSATMQAVTMALEVH